MVRIGKGWTAAVVLAAAVTAGHGAVAREPGAGQPPATETKVETKTETRTTTEPPTEPEKSRSRLGGAVDSLKKSAANAGDAVKRGFEAAKDSVTRMGVESRVYARIHWDRDLHAARIDLAAPASGTIELRGAVASARLKSKAVELVRETLGVTAVVDHLTVDPASSPAPGASPAADPDRP